MEISWQGHAGLGAGVIINIATSCLYSIPVRDQLGEYGTITKDPSYTDASYGVANCVNAMATNMFYSSKKKCDYSYVIFRTLVDEAPVIIGFMHVKEIKNVYSNHFLRHNGNCECAALREHYAIKGNIHFVSWSDAASLTKFWIENCSEKVKGNVSVLNASDTKALITYAQTFENVTAECEKYADEMRFSDTPEELFRKGQSQRFLRYDFFKDALSGVKKKKK